MMPTVPKLQEARTMIRKLLTLLLALFALTLSVHAQSAAREAGSEG